jgi:hypothetical protein
MLLLAVAPHTVPDVFVEPLVNVIAAEHSSLGGGVTVILKPALLLMAELPAENTLI